MNNTRLFAAVSLLAGVSLVLSCARGPYDTGAVDAGIQAEINSIRAIDNHAHPVRVTGKDEKPDREFDALPVDNMEES
jgi:hypothetical protein